MNNFNWLFYIFYQDLQSLIYKEEILFDDKSNIEIIFVDILNSIMLI